MFKHQSTTFEQIGDAVFDELKAVASVRTRVAALLPSGCEFVEFGVDTITWRWHPVETLPPLTACAAAIGMAFGEAGQAGKEA